MSLAAPTRPGRRGCRPFGNVSTNHRLEKCRAGWPTKVTAYLRTHLLESYLAGKTRRPWPRARGEKMGKGRSGLTCAVLTDSGPSLTQTLLHCPSATPSTNPIVGWRPSEGALYFENFPLDNAASSWVCRLCALSCQPTMPRSIQPSISDFLHNTALSHMPAFLFSLVLLFRPCQSCLWFGVTRKTLPPSPSLTILGMGGRPGTLK